MNIGFIGIGNMGLPMSANLINAGYALTVYDIRDEAMREAKLIGAKTSKNPKELTQTSDIIITSLPSQKSLEDVVLLEDGVLEGAGEGKILIDTSTVSPSTIRRIALKVNYRGIEVLDAPVSGGVSGAKSGTLTVMVGGKIGVFESCKEILCTIGKNVYYVGPLGSGNTVKLVNNLISLVNVVTLSEGMVLGVKSGVNPKTLFDIIRVSTGNSYALEVKLQNKISKGKFDGGFAIDLACKDLGLAIELGRDIGLPLFITNTAQQVYELARAKNMGRMDHTAVIKLLEEVTQIEVRY